MSNSVAELEQLYCNCRQQLFTCALLITRSAARAEDAVHDAFCRLLRQNSSPQNLKAYVFRAVRNAAVDQVRRGPSPNELLPDYIFDPHRTPAAVAEDVEFARQLNSLVQQLKSDERETIVQHLYGELTFQEIATIRGAPLGTVVSWYRRGLEKLRQKMEIAGGSV